MQQNEKYEFDFTVGWTAALLQGITEHPDNTYASFERCACFHYKNNNMNDVIQKYIRNLDDFLDFLSKSWGWKITKSSDSKKIVIDENKNFCIYMKLLFRAKVSKGAYACYILFPHYKLTYVIF